MRLMLATTMLALLTLAPLAVAQEANETQRPDDAAWVEDCPPDMMCAYGSEDCIECSGPGAVGPEDCVDCLEPTRGPADGSCENCRGDTVDTCMDGQDEGEVCDDDVQYFGPGPADTGAQPVSTESDATNAVPGASFALVAVAMALAIFLLARRA